MEPGADGRDHAAGMLGISERQVWPQWSPALTAGITPCTGTEPEPQPTAAITPCTGTEPEPQPTAAMEPGADGRDHGERVMILMQAAEQPQWSPALTAGITPRAMAFYEDDGFMPQWSPALTAGITSSLTG